MTRTIAAVATAILAIFFIATISYATDSMLKADFIGQHTGRQERRTLCQNRGDRRPDAGRREIPGRGSGYGIWLTGNCGRKAQSRR